MREARWVRMWQGMITGVAIAAAANLSWGDETAASAEAPLVIEREDDPRSYQTTGATLGISPYEPVYFSLGFNERIHAKFQISLKFRPFTPVDEKPESEHFWSDLYAAYTQTSIWDLESDSKPFFDSSYRPAVFYYRKDVVRLFGADVSFTGGFEHESNGKGGAESRSINILFAQPSFWWKLTDKWDFVFSPKMYTYLENSENPDIAEYRGYVDWGVAISDPLGVRISARLRVGTNGSWSTLVDGSYPLRDITPLRKLGLVNGYLHVQYFAGFGETILRYNQKDPWQLRVGLMIIR